MDQTRRGRPIRARILMGLGGVVAGGVLIIAVLFALLGAVAQSSVDNSTHALALTNAAHVVSQVLADERTAVLEYVSTGSPTAASSFRTAADGQVAAIGALRSLVATDPALAPLVDDVSTAAASWRSDWADPTVGGPGIGLLPAGVDLSPANGTRLFADASLAISTLDTQIAQHNMAAISSPADEIRLIAESTAVAGLLLCLGTLGIGLWLVRVVTTPLGRLSRTALDQLDGKPDIRFRQEGNSEIGALSVVLEQLRVDVADRYETARLEGLRAATLNQLSDLISFASSEADLVGATVSSLTRLAPTPRGDVQIANASRNRLVYAGAWGSDAPLLDSPVPVERIDRCPGIRRSAAFVTPDVTDALAVRCPAHPTLEGGLACIPLIAMGQVVGVIHLESQPDRPFDESTVATAGRVAEQVAVAIANARLMKTMEGLAMTDALTGLRNARFFDTYLEQELAAAARDEQPLAIVMIDIDHFKGFNDTHGHPAGDEALRAFGRVLKASVRSADVVARYGGEEFIVALHHTGLEGALVTAEKLRAAVEQTIVEIAPGRYARITISLGVVATDVHLLDQKGLVALADAALYRAKEGGRNRVEAGPISEGTLQAVASSRAGGNRRMRARQGGAVPVLLPASIHAGSAEEA